VEIDVRSRRRLRLEVDGREAPRTAGLGGVLLPARYRLLI
jgi:hypothetical protein